MARAHPDINVRVTVRPDLGEIHSVRLSRASRGLETGIPWRYRPRDLSHGWSDIKRAIPFSLWTSITGAIRCTVSGAFGDIGRHTSRNDAFETETKVQAYVNGDSDSIRR